MATIINPKDFIHLLHCSCNIKSQWYIEKSEVVCNACNKRFQITDSILELVDPTLLDEETQRELNGNSYDHSEEILSRYANSKRRGSEFYAHLQSKNFTFLSKYLKKVDLDTIFLLGCGTAGEVRSLSQLLKFNTIYLSDLSYSALYIAPFRLKYNDINIGLFTSDLDNCPIHNKEIPIIIYEALHHTSDMHRTIEKFLCQGYHHIFFVEPTNNLLIKWLSKYGKAQRIEYSGVKPGRLSLHKLYSLCEEYEYKPLITTLWHFPEDYYKKYIKFSGFLQRIFFLLLDAFSLISRPFKFGNESIIYLHKLDSYIPNKQS